MNADAPRDGANDQLLRTDHLTATCESPTLTRINSRGLSLTIDEPEERHGTNAALSPTETFMASLMGCVNVLVSNVARRRGVAIRVLNIDLEYDFDRRGTRAGMDIAVPFREVRLKVEVESAASQAEIDAVQQDYNKACPVTRMIRSAGCPIVETWTVRRPSAAG